MERIRPNTKVQVLDPAYGSWKIWDVFPGHLAPNPNDEHVEALNAALSDGGAQRWNAWRAEHPSEQPDLTGLEFAAWQGTSGPEGVDLSGYDLSGAIMNGCRLPFARLSSTDLSGAQLRESLVNQASIVRSDLSNADLTQASLTGVQCFDTSFRGADLSRAMLHASTLMACDFDGADLEDAAFDGATLSSSTFCGASLRSARFGASTLAGCVFREADLSGAHFVKTDLDHADLSGARVYAVNCWDSVITEATVQSDLVVTAPSSPTIAVDDIRVAQFIHLLLTNDNLLTVMNTLGEKAVLLLGRFGDGGLDVLRGIAQHLRVGGYLPMIFEFDRPPDRTYTEVVRTLAGLARFVVVDLSGPSVPQELGATVPHLQIPYVPICQTGRAQYSMFKDWLANEWVLGPVVEFEDLDHLVDQLDSSVIQPAERRVEERRTTLAKIFASDS